MKESIRLLKTSGGIIFARIYPNKNGFDWDVIEVVGGDNKKDILRLIFQMIVGLLKPILTIYEK